MKLRLQNIRAEHVREAIKKYEQLGEDEVRRKYEFGRAKSYWLVHNGKKYPSKAIVGIAHGFANPDLGPIVRTKAPSYKGGKPIRKILETCGFEVPVEDCGNPR